MPEQADISEAQALAYLQSHPEMLKAHPQLLAELALPHDSGSAISLIERQVQVLRERNILLRRQLNELLKAARANDELFTKVRTLTLALLEVSGWHELNEVLATLLLADFEADFLCCHLLREQLHLDHLLGHPQALPTAAFIRNGQPRCLAMRSGELQQVFPIQEHDQDGSAVLLPLALRSCEGCLAIGSRDPQRFLPDMDTLFLSYISDVISRIIDHLSAAAVGGQHGRAA